MRAGVIVGSSVLAALALAFSPAAARAAPSETRACIAAFDDGQRHRTDGKLRAARERLLACSQSECPAVLRSDCANVLREVEAATPSIVLAASDRRGRDLTDVRVELDGRVLAERLDGRAIEVDPGKLVLRFHRPPWEPAVVQIVVAQGDKSRQVRATLGPPLPAEETPSASGSEPRSFAGWAAPAGFGLVGLGALGFAGATRLSAGAEADRLRGECAPECSRADRDRLSSDLVAANVALGIGIGCVALAVVTWVVLGPRAPHPQGRAAAFAW